MKQAGSIDQKVEETDTGLFEAKTEENQKPVVAFEETGCVEGSWEKDDHENMIPSENTNVKKEHDTLMNGLIQREWRQILGGMVFIRRSEVLIRGLTIILPVIFL